MKRKPPGLPRSVRTPENVDTVRRAVLVNHRRSARRRALTLGKSRISLNRILHELKYHPYKIMIVQQLAEWDFAQRRDFCEEMLAILSEDATAVVMMTDEAHFHLNGFVQFSFLGQIAGSGYKGLLTFRDLIPSRYSGCAGVSVILVLQNHQHTLNIGTNKLPKRRKTFTSRRGCLPEKIN